MLLQNRALKDPRFWLSVDAVDFLSRRRIPSRRRLQAITMMVVRRSATLYRRSGAFHCVGARHSRGAVCSSVRGHS